MLQAVITGWLSPVLHPHIKNAFKAQLPQTPMAFRKSTNLPFNLDPPDDKNDVQKYPVEKRLDQNRRYSTLSFGQHKKLHFRHAFGRLFWDPEKRDQNDQDMRTHQPAVV